MTTFSLEFFDISGSGVYLVGDEAVEMINIDSGDLMTSLNIENEKVMSEVTVAITHTSTQI